MKRWGTIPLMLFAFVVGFVSTYNCGGGGGSSSNAADYAPLVHQHDAADITSGELGISLIPSHTHSDYALSDHSHDDYADSQHIHDSGDLLDGGIHNIHITGRAAIAGTAETLDGMDSTDFAEASHTHDSSDITGTITANNLNGFIATDIQDMIDAICYLSRAIGVDLAGYDFAANCFQYVFVTSTAWNGGFGGADVADGQCQALAEAAGLPGNYLAWISKDNTGPTNRFVKSSYPYILVDGTLVASDWSDLTDGTLVNPIDVDEAGNTISSSTNVWTNVVTGGALNTTQDDVRCNNWATAAPAVNGKVGIAVNTDSEWTDAVISYAGGYQSCFDPARFYCFQQ